MSRHRPLRQPFSPFRGVGLPVAGGLLMLALLYQLIVWTRNADNWRWLAPRAAASGPKLLASVPARPRPAAPLPKATGPTDEDPDQAETAREEFQALTDGTLTMSREDMFAYNRLVFWVANQSFARLERRARHGLWYTDLYDQPDKHRGELVALDVTVCMTRRGVENEYGVKLYDVWAVTPESRSRLYDLIVLDYPKNMPQGYDIRENARFAGYFLKLQGYEPAAAKPGQRPEKAPVLIGRLEWTSPSPTAAGQPEQSLWGGDAFIMWAALIVCGGLVLAFWFAYRRRGRQAPLPRVAISPSGEPMAIDRWLEQGLNAEDDEADRRDGTAP